MLSRLTNKLKSTIHQVVNRPEKCGNFALFIPFSSSERNTIECFENCVDENHPKLYEDTTAGDFLYERLVELGLIKI